MFASTATDKPPLGVMPEYLWREKRAEELARAIHESIAAGHYKNVATWMDELDRLWPDVMRHFSESENEKRRRDAMAAVFGQQKPPHAVRGAGAGLLQ